MPNFYANVGKTGGTRNPVDRYETPTSATIALLNRIQLGGPILEPACGTGRMVRALESRGHEVHGFDLLEDGLDYLKHDGYPEHDHVVANPPYMYEKAIKMGLAEAFVHRALDTCDGTVAMLLRTGFLGGQKRYERLFSVTPPSHVFYFSSRIHFFQADGTRISGQVHEHCWIVWRGQGLAGVPPVDFIGPQETPDFGRE
jgi:SAM-dependent methyltransferase